MESLKDEDQVMRDMAERMMVKFDKYWDEYNTILAFGAILDPRMKLKILGYCYEDRPSYLGSKVREDERKIVQAFL